YFEDSRLFWAVTSRMLQRRAAASIAEMNRDFFIMGFVCFALFWHPRKNVKDYSPSFQTRRFARLSPPLYVRFPNEQSNYQRHAISLSKHHSCGCFCPRLLADSCAAKHFSIGDQRARRYSARCRAQPGRSFREIVGR